MPRVCCSCRKGFWDEKLCPACREGADASAAAKVVRGGLRVAYHEKQVEVVAGNIAKQEFWKGQISAFKQIGAVIGCAPYLAEWTKAADAVPHTWLDSMLTGPERVIGNPPYDCKDVQKILQAVRKRIIDLP